jgi:hypothetical protein
MSADARQRRRQSRMKRLADQHPHRISVGRVPDRGDDRAGRQGPRRLSHGRLLAGDRLPQSSPASLLRFKPAVRWRNTLIVSPGTESSNLSPSSGESAKLRSLARDPQAATDRVMPGSRAMTNRRHGPERASLSLVKRSGLDSIQWMCCRQSLSGRDPHWPAAVILAPKGFP